MKKRTSVIDLTPLLDVVFVILFLFIAKASTKNNKTIQEKEDIIAEQIQTISQLENQNNNLQSINNELSNINNFNLYASIVDITFIEKKNNMEIIISSNDNKHINIPFKPSSAESKNKLLDSLNQIKREDSNPIIIVFSYDENTIHREDYFSIYNTILEFQKNCESVFYNEKTK